MPRASASRYAGPSSSLRYSPTESVLVGAALRAVDTTIGPGTDRVHVAAERDGRIAFRSWSCVADEDLDALLSGVVKKPTQQPGSSTVDEGATGQAEVNVDASGEVKSEPANQTDISGEAIKEEDPNESAVTAPPPVVFKKRKAKR